MRCLERLIISHSQSLEAFSFVRISARICATHFEFYGGFGTGILWRFWYAHQITLPRLDKYVYCVCCLFFFFTIISSFAINMNGLPVGVYPDLPRQEFIQKLVHLPVSVLRSLRCFPTKRQLFTLWFHVTSLRFH